MPGYKRYRRRGYKKRPVRRYRRRRSNGLRKSVARLWRQVGSPEYKYTNDTFAAASTNVGAVYDLCNPSLGTGDLDERIGDKIRIQHLTIRGHFNYSTSNAVIRMIIFLDKQDTVGSVGDLLIGAGSPSIVDSSKVYDKRFNTKIYKDIRFVSNTEKPQKIFAYNFKLNLPVQFSNGTTTINTNSLKLLVVTDVTTAAIYNITSRVTYLDN